MIMNLTKKDYEIIGKMWEMKSSLSEYRLALALKLGRPLEKLEIVHQRKKIRTLLYLEQDTKEQLDIYCTLSKRKNKTKIYNEAITEYLNSRLKDEYKKKKEINNGR